MGEIITLTPLEMQVARLMAQARGNGKRASGVTSQRYATERSDSDVDMVGACGELAVAKALNLYPALWGALHGDNGLGDLHLGILTLEIKVNRYARGDFRLKAGQAALGADVGVLVYASPQPARFEVHGWIDRRIFRDAAKDADYGHGPRVVVGPEHFLPLAELRAIISAEVS